MEKMEASPVQLYLIRRRREGVFFMKKKNTAQRQIALFLSGRTGVLGQHAQHLVDREKDCGPEGVEHQELLKKLPQSFVVVRSMQKKKGTAS